MQGILLSEDIDVMYHGVLKYDFFGHEAWITTTHVCLFIVMLILLIFSIVAGHILKKGTEVPGAFQNAIELMVEKLDGMIVESLGSHAPAFRNYLCTIFVFILFSNISGLLGLRPPTADYSVTLPLALITFVMIHFNKFKYNSIKQIWTDLCSPLPPWLPVWFPLNLIGELAVPLSLSLRLFANVLSGT